MAIYKPNNCRPFLEAVDLTGGADPSLREDIYIECEINTSNIQVTGYKLRILDSENNIIFGDIDGIQRPYTPISQTTGIILNGDTLKVPLIVFDIDKLTWNNIYNDGYNFCCKISDTGIDYVNFLNNDYYYQPYKWQITLAQGQIVNGEFKQIPIDHKWYDMEICRGEILGSTPNRIQSKLSEEIYKDYYIQLINNEGNVGNRHRIIRYDNTFGYIYPVEGEISQEDLSIATQFNIYKETNNPQFVSESRKVDYIADDSMAHMGISLRANITKNDGNIVINDYCFGQTATQSGGIDNIMDTLGLAVNNNWTIKDGDIYFEQNYTLTTHNVYKVVGGNYKPVSLLLPTSNENLTEPTKEDLQTRILPALAATFVPKVSWYTNNKNSQLVFSAGHTTLLSTHEEGSLTPLNGVFTFVQSQYAVLNNNVGSDVLGMLTVRWRRSTNASTWGSIINRTFFIQQTNENWVVKLDNKNTEGILNKTDLFFIPEEPVKLYELPGNSVTRASFDDFPKFGENNYYYIASDTQNIYQWDGNRYQFYNTVSKITNIGDIYRNSKTETYIRPFIGIASGHSLTYINSKTRKENYITIETVDTNKWAITHQELLEPMVIGTQYSINSFFKQSDENPFYGYDEPSININLFNNKLLVVASKADLDVTYPAGIEYVNKNVLVTNEKKYYRCGKKDNGIYTWLEVGLKYELYFNVVQTETELLLNDILIGKCVYIEDNRQYKICEYLEVPDFSTGVNVVWNITQVPVVNTRILKVYGDYIQKQYGQWVNYQWILTDLTTGRVNTMPIYYNGVIYAKFEGLQNGHNYSIKLIIEDSYNNILIKELDIKVLVEVTEDSLPFSAKFECDTHTIKLETFSLETIIPEPYPIDINNPSGSGLLYTDNGLRIMKDISGRDYGVKYWQKSQNSLLPTGAEDILTIFPGYDSLCINSEHILEKGFTGDIFNLQVNIGKVNTGDQDIADMYMSLSAVLPPNALTMFQWYKFYHDMSLKALSSYTDAMYMSFLTLLWYGAGVGMKQVGTMLDEIWSTWSKTPLSAVLSTENFDQQLELANAMTRVTDYRNNLYYNYTIPPVNTGGLGVPGDYIPRQLYGLHPLQIIKDGHKVTQLASIKPATFGMLNINEEVQEKYDYVLADGVMEGHLDTIDLIYLFNMDEYIIPHVSEFFPVYTDENVPDILPDYYLRVKKFKYENTELDILCIPDEHDNSVSEFGFYIAGDGYDVNNFFCRVEYAKRMSDLPLVGELGVIYQLENDREAAFYYYPGYGYYKGLKVMGTTIIMGDHPLVMDPTAVELKNVSGMMYTVIGFNLYKPLFKSITHMNTPDSSEPVVDYKLCDNTYLYNSDVIIRNPLATSTVNNTHTKTGVWLDNGTMLYHQADGRVLNIFIGEAGRFIRYNLWTDTKGETEQTQVWHDVIDSYTNDVYRQRDVSDHNVRDQAIYNKNLKFNINLDHYIPTSVDFKYFDIKGEVAIEEVTDV